MKIIFTLSVILLSLTHEIPAQSGQSYVPYKINIKDNIENVKSINLSRIGKELKYFPLETKPECLIQKIDKVLFSDEYMFISDYDRLLQFDKNGKFIRQIGSAGRGPSEYINVNDFCINKQEKEIYITFISPPSKLMIFDFNGKFKRSFNIPYNASQIIQINQKNIMFQIANNPGLITPGWLLTNNQGSVVSSIKNSTVRKNTPGLVVTNTPFYSFLNSCHFMEYCSDTLYCLKEGKKEPYSVFFMGDLKMDPEYVIKASTLKKEGNKLWISRITENSGNMFLEFSRGITNGYIRAIFDKTSSDIIIVKDDTFLNDLDGGARFWPKQIIDDKIMVDWVDAYELLKPLNDTMVRKERTELINIKKQLTVTSNPVIIILYP